MPEQWTRLSEARKKQCANCGLLGQMRLAENDLVPMLEEFRGRDARRGGFLPFLKEGGGNYGGTPICAAGERDFTMGSNLPQAYGMDRGQWNNMLALPMPDCPSFIQWVPGLNINDHQMMLSQRNAWAREDRRDQEMRYREDDRDAAMRQRELDRDKLTNDREDGRDRREDKRDRDVDTRHKQDLKTVAIVTILAAAIGAGATLSATTWFGRDAKSVVVVTATIPTPISQQQP